MKFSYSDLRGVDFSPLSEVKARLSEKVRGLMMNKRRIAITTNGRPTAVLLSYEDYLSLLSQFPKGPEVGGGKVISIERWEKDRKKREAVRDSILGLFDMRSLSRKGKKKYKEDTLREFSR